MLSPQEIADRVGISYDAVLRAIHRGELEGHEVVPRRIRVDIEEYERWRLRPMRKKPQAAPEPDHLPRTQRRRTASLAAELDAIEQEAA